MAGTFGLQWHITNKCDNRCKHCYIYAKEEIIKQQEFTLFDAKKTLEKFIGFCCRVKKKPFINLTGGDPLLYTHIYEFIGCLAEKNISYSIMGNSYHLDLHVLNYFKENNCRSYQLSIDGLQKTHDLIRGNGSFNDTIEKINLLKRNGIKVKIMTTVSILNYLELPNIAELVADLNVDAFGFARYCPVNENLSSTLAPETYKELLGTMFNKYKELSHKKTNFTFKDHLWKLYFYEMGLYKINNDNIVYDGCGCGIRHMTLLENGNVYACRRFDSLVGNILNSDFYEIFFSNNMNKYRRIEMLEKCGNCILLNYCRGCHAVSYGILGDYFKKDPQCWKEIKNR
jgi:radical SAM/SPASM domain protein of ACGX system